VHLEVPAWDVPVLDGVGAQLRGDERDDVVGVAVVRDAPGVETGAEAHRELVHRDG
jgi:hypothetical protein